MKNFWVNVLLAFIIWQLSTYLFNHTTPSHILEEELARFNHDVEYGNILKDYHIEKETHPNELSNSIELVSDFSRQTISVFVDMTMGIINAFD